MWVFVPLRRILQIQIQILGVHALKSNTLAWTPSPLEEKLEVVHFGFRRCAYGIENVFSARGPSQPLPATKRLRACVAPVEHGTSRARRLPSASLAPRRAPCTCCSHSARAGSSGMRTAGAWERGGTNLSVRRPGITCPDVLDQRDARPQPLRGRQRLWWPTVLIVGSDFLQTRRRTLSFAFRLF